MPYSTTLSGYLCVIGQSSFTRDFDAAGSASNQELLPVSGYAATTLSDFLQEMAQSPVVVDSPLALLGGALTPGSSDQRALGIPLSLADEAGMLVVETLLQNRLTPVRDPLEDLPRAVLARLQRLAVQTNF